MSALEEREGREWTRAADRVISVLMLPHILVRRAQDPALRIVSDDLWSSVKADRCAFR